MTDDSSQPLDPDCSSKARSTRLRLSDDRVDALLDIATEVFLSQGFADASMAEIARRGNASKTTFYARYRTKEELFLAVIERRVQRVLAQIAVFREAATLEETLTEFGQNLLRVALSPEQLALIRLINAESSRHPELAARFYAHGPIRGEQALAAYLTDRVRHGELGGEEPLTMARFYMSLVTGSPIRWFVLSPAFEGVSAADMQAHVRSVVALFLAAYVPPAQRRHSV